MNWLNTFSKHIPNIRRSGKNYVAICPFPDHNDTQESFSIFNVESGGFKCFGCGRKGNGFNFLRMVKGGLPPKEIYQNPPKIKKKLGDFVEAYPYESLSGTVQFEVCRYKNPKSFRPRVTLENADVQYSLPQHLRIPYRLPEILWTKRPIIFVEGEKDVDALRANGFTATTTPFGSNSWNKDAFAKYFEDKFVILIPDNDDAGLSFMNLCALDISRAGGSCKIVKPKTISAEPKEDVFDFFHKYKKTREEFIQEVNGSNAKYFFAQTDPVLYFDKKNILLTNGNNTLPSKFRPEILHAYETVTNEFGSKSLKPEAEPILEKIEKILDEKSVGHMDYLKMLYHLKQLHEVLFNELC